MVPKVSVIIPAYNIAPFIRQAVESALTQTTADLEVFVIDDGSTDRTVERLAGITDPRLQIIRKEHAGVSRSRNLGIQMARAPYIGFLDGDDLWLPNKIEKHLKIMEIDPDADLTFSFSRTIESSGRNYGLPMQKPMETISFHTLLRENPIRTASSVVVRREVLVRSGPFDSCISGCEDYDLWLRIAGLRPNNIRCLSEVLTLYRRRPGQLTGDWRALEVSWIRMIEKHRASYHQEPREIESRAKCRMYSYFASIAYEQRNFLAAIQLIGAAVRAHPWTSMLGVRNWALTLACFSGILLPSGLHRKLEEACTRLGRAVPFWSAPK